MVEDFRKGVPNGREKVYRMVDLCTGKQELYTGYPQNYSQKVLRGSDSKLMKEMRVLVRDPENAGWRGK